MSTVRFASAGSPRGYAGYSNPRSLNEEALLATTLDRASASASDIIRRLVQDYLNKWRASGRNEEETNRAAKNAIGHPGI